MDSQADTERRNFERLKRNLSVSYEFKQGGKGYGSCTTRDISELGIKIVTDSFLPKSSLMVVHITLKPYKVLDLTARVAWSQRLVSSYHYYSGLEFVDLSPQIKQKISAYLAAYK